MILKSIDSKASIDNHLVNKRSSSKYISDQRSTQATPNIKDLKRLQRSARHAAKNNSEENKDQVIYANVRRLSDRIDAENFELCRTVQEASRAIQNKTLYLSETKVKNKKNRFMKYNQVREFNRDKPVLLFKEKLEKKLRIYLVTNINDISTMRAIEKEEQQRVTTINQNPISNSMLKKDEENNEKSSDSASFEDFFQESNNDQPDGEAADIMPSRPSATFFGQESVLSSAYTYGRSSVINFKNTICKHKPHEKLKASKMNPDSPKESYKIAFEK